MITMQEAQQIAAEWLQDISGCTEFTTAYVFYNPRTEYSIGGPDASVVVMKETGQSFVKNRARASQRLKKALLWTCEIWNLR